jgi:hypothetical protein
MPNYNYKLKTVNDLMAKEYSNVKLGKLMEISKLNQASQEKSNELIEDIQKDEKIWQEMF